MNRSTLFGVIVSPVTLHQTGNGNSVCNFHMQTADKVRGEHRIEDHRIVVWGDKADRCARELSQGDVVFVEGPKRTHAGLTEVHAKRVEW